MLVTCGQHWLCVSLIPVLIYALVGAPFHSVTYLPPPVTALLVYIMSPLAQAVHAPQTQEGGGEVVATEGRDHPVHR